MEPSPSLCVAFRGAWQASHRVQEQPLRVDCQEFPGESHRCPQLAFQKVQQHSLQHLPGKFCCPRGPFPAWLSPPVSTSANCTIQWASTPSSPISSESQPLGGGGWGGGEEGAPKFVFPRVLGLSPRAGLLPRSAILDSLEFFYP